MTTIEHEMATRRRADAEIMNAVALLRLVRESLSRLQPWAVNGWRLLEAEKRIAEAVGWLVEHREKG